MEDNKKTFLIKFSEEEIKKLEEFVRDEQLSEEEVAKMWLEKNEFLKKLQVKIEEGECLDFSEMD